VSRRPFPAAGNDRPGRTGTAWLIGSSSAARSGSLAGINALCVVRHVFTHFSLDLHLVVKAEPQGDGWWQPLDSIENAGLPTLYRKAIDAVLANHDRLAA
jgi:A/G-specific adenine glycosylase